tara:strand:+ start:9551 stop:10534 length:984 start_codon:yes stop_codon:yes gene_type:complete
MAIKWTKIEETSTDGYMPTTTANTWNTGINAPGGPVEFLTLRYKLTFADTPTTTGEISNLISGLRVVLNGEVVHDFTAGYASSNPAVSAGPSQYAYLINHIGGRVVEVPNAAESKTREGYINIPLGRQTPAGVNRYEITVNWAATVAGSTIDTGSMSWWLRFNDGMQTTTQVVPATSFLSSISNEQVVVRVPQNVPGVVSALLVLNDSEADELGTQGIRINALSDFGIDAMQYRMQNGDLDNGIMWNEGSSQDIQTYSSRLSGALLIPVFGLTGGDIVLSVDSSAATTRRYLPIITNPVGAQTKPDVKQTQRQTSNTSKAILRGSLE